MHIDAWGSNTPLVSLFVSKLDVAQCEIHIVQQFMFSKSSEFLERLKEHLCCGNMINGASALSSPRWGVRRSSGAGARAFLRPNFRPETCVSLC